MKLTVVPTELVELALSASWYCWPAVSVVALSYLSRLSCNVSLCFVYMSEPHRCGIGDEGRGLLCLRIVLVPC